MKRGNEKASEAARWPLAQCGGALHRYSAVSDSAALGSFPAPPLRRPPCRSVPPVPLSEFLVDVNRTGSPHEHWMASRSEGVLADRLQSWTSAQPPVWVSRFESAVKLPVGGVLLRAVLKGV